MISVKNLFDNDDVKIIERIGNISVIEYQRDLSVNKVTAMSEYFAAKMNVRRRQVVIQLQGDEYVTSAGAMQWMAGSVGATTGIKGVGDFASKIFKGAATGESAIKPEYVGNGYLMLEPTYKYLLLEDVGDWDGGLVLDDGLYLASESTVEYQLEARSNLPSAALGNKGLFNLKLAGKGICALESNVAREQLITVDLVDDELKVDGSFAICWSGSLKFTVEKAGKTLIGSAVSGEGFVNVYKGTGRVLLSPLDNPATLYSAGTPQRKSK